MKRSWKITIGSIGLWIFGMIALRTILIMSGSAYPMLDGIPNPRYKSELHSLVAYLMAAWSVVCLIVTSLWWKATRNDHP